MRLDDAAELLQVVDRYEQDCLDEMAALRTDARPAVETMRDRLLAEERRLVLEARMKWILYARHQLAAVGAPPRRPAGAEPS